jgi:hypothetical protein
MMCISVIIWYDERFFILPMLSTCRNTILTYKKHGMKTCYIKIIISILITVMQSLPLLLLTQLLIMLYINRCHLCTNTSTRAVTDFVIRNKRA